MGSHRVDCRDTPRTHCGDTVDTRGDTADTTRAHLGHGADTPRKLCADRLWRHRGDAAVTPQLVWVLSRYIRQRMLSKLQLGKLSAGEYVLGPTPTKRGFRGELIDAGSDSFRSEPLGSSVKIDWLGLPSPLNFPASSGHQACMDDRRKLYLLV